MLCLWYKAIDFGAGKSWLAVRPEGIQRLQSAGATWQGTADMVGAHPPRRAVKEETGSPLARGRDEVPIVVEPHLREGGRVRVWGSNMQRTSSMKPRA